MVTSDFRSEVEIPPFRACAMKNILMIVIINRKLHTSFRLVPTSMTFDLERCISPYLSYFAFFHRIFDSFAGRLCHSG